MERYRERTGTISGTIADSDRTSESVTASKLLNMTPPVGQYTSRWKPLAGQPFTVAAYGSPISPRSVLTVCLNPGDNPEE